ncbi:hypothetical protein K461DRAFT_114677 [Myriangium duriaei CBS 260.36]|uniref:Putative transcription factor kapC n=1 Tax=Myriangium duriaei CBS 260.36 TaxID=1168546 RepID=A0A9P4J780_9PEZI|nr:hypothetical protein K461DRAFT_114677 [Myriangium duriaei CBS 260.36]
MPAPTSRQVHDTIPVLHTALLTTSQDLRDRLLAAHTGQQPQDPDAAQQSIPPLPYPTDSRQPPTTDGQIDPSIGGSDTNQHRSPPNYDMGGIMQDSALLDAQKNAAAAAGRRELSTTKRAAQNRAAQRAFRQRKEAYITKLEKQVQDYHAMEEEFKQLQHENYELREYILSLQSRLLESSAELPPPPSRVHLGQPGHHQRSPHSVEPHRMDIDPQTQGHISQSQPAPTASMAGPTQPAEDGITQAAVEQLQAAAAEAGELGVSDSKAET